MALIEIDTILLLLEQICLGSLISGLILFFLTLFLQGSHIFDHDTDIDHDIDHDVSLDHGSMDLGDADIDSDIDLDIDHDVGLHVDKHFDIKDHAFEADNPTPLMLLLGTFLMTFGGIGTILLQTSINPIFIIGLTFIIPIGATYGISKLWGKLAVSDIYETPLQTIKIDDKVKTITTVDTDGGLVVIETSSIHGPIKIAAKTRYGAIAKDMEAYVIQIGLNAVIIDEWPSSEENKKPIPDERSIRWD